MAKKSLKGAIKNLDRGDLPTTRKEQFSDIMRNNFRKLVAIGFILFIFSIPFIVVYILKSFYISSLVSSLTEGGADIDADGFMQICSMANIFNLIQVPAIAIFFLGLSGVAKIYKELCWGNPTFISQQLFKGIKENWLTYVLSSLYISISLFLFDFLFYFGTASQSTLLPILAVLIVVVLVFVLMPIIFVSLALSSVYKDKYLHHFKNAAMISFKHYLPFVLFPIILAGTYFLLYIPNIVFACIAIILVILYLLPIVLLAHHLYNLHQFDKYINNNYPTILNKGLSKKKEEVDKSIGAIKAPDNEKMPDVNKSQKENNDINKDKLD